MKILLLALSILTITISAQAISTSTKAKEEAKAKRQAELEREVVTTQQVIKQTVQLEELNNSNAEIEVKLQKLYEQQAITNALLRELIKLQAANQ